LILFLKSGLEEQAYSARLSLTFNKKKQKNLNLLLKRDDIKSKKVENYRWWQ